MAKNEGRGVSEIVRETLTDWLRKKNSASASDFITFTPWVEIHNNSNGFGVRELLTD